MHFGEHAGVFSLTKHAVNKVMNLNVGQDATVGEVIDDWIRMLYPWGGRLPKLDEVLREDLKWKLRLFAFGRISRIAEN